MPDFVQALEKKIWGILYSTLLKHLELNLFHSKNTSQSIQLTLFFCHCKYSNSCSISPKGKKKLVTAGITTSWLVSMKRLFPIQEYRKSAVADFHEEPWGSKARLPHLGHPNTWMQDWLQPSLASGLKDIPYTLKGMEWPPKHVK